MPTYGYECNECKDQFEVFQKMSDDPLAVHEGCGGSLRRLLYSVGIVFKGPGIYLNAYAKKSSNSQETKTDSKTETKPADSTKTEKPAETKTESKTETKKEAAATA